MAFQYALISVYCKRENTVSRSMESRSLYYCASTLENNTYAMDSLEVLSSLHGIEGAFTTAEHNRSCAQSSFVSRQSHLIN